MLTDLLGISPATVSALMLVVFAGDLVFDIASGLLASWALARGFGYRRVIALGAAPCGAAFALLYSLPALGHPRIGVLAAILLIFRAAYAIVDVPHNSLIARVARDSHARGRTSGYRLFFSSLAGLAIATILTPSVGQAARLGMTGKLAVLGIVAGTVAGAALWLAAWSSARDRGDGGEAGLAASPTRITLFPRPDRLLAAMALVSFVTGFAMPMFGRMTLYLATYVLDRPAFASRILLAVTLGQFPGVLLWTWLVRFGEKTTLLALAYAVAIAGILLFALAGAHPALLVGAAALAGAGLAGVFMLPWGIMADVIDFAEFHHRERRETATFAAMLVILKASAAASVSVIGGVLGQLGYVPGIRQAPAVLWGMKALAFGVPIIGGGAAILVLLRLSVGHRAHARVLRALAARSTRAIRDRAGPPDPPASRPATGGTPARSGRGVPPPGPADSPARSRYAR